MHFDPKLHKETPAGYEQENREATIRELKRKDEYLPVRSWYRIPNNIRLAGIETRALAILETEYKPGKLKRNKIDQQSAKVLLTLDPAYEKSQSEIDNYKLKYCEELLYALAGMFTKQGYRCELDTTFSLAIHLDDRHEQRIFKEFTNIARELKKLSASYAKGQTPLEDLPELEFDTQPPNASFVANHKSYANSEEKGEYWQSLVNTSEQQEEIERLARKLFPEGKAVAPIQHELFAKELNDLLSRQR